MFMSDCLYPKLRKLHLTDSSPRAMPYVVSKFPSITHLSVNPCRRDWSSFEDDFNEYQQLREENMLDQIEDNQTWKRLHEFRGDLLGLYLMAPICQIPRLILQGVDQEHLQVLGPILDTAKPEYLELDVYGDLFGPSEQDIPALLRLPGRASLTGLSLFVEIRKADHLSDMAVSMGTVLESLTALPLESIQFSLYARDDLDLTPRRTMHFAPDPNKPDGLIARLSPPHTPSPLLPVERSLDRFDPSQYATQLADAVPTIKAVDIDVYGPRTRKRTMRSRRGENGTMVSL
ncbi:hypothetical protein C8Q80DRAFT_81954 [Daedaleopsis nitida]|nr:hypothetical protein C8Q80DRAFT_81954 [Daedaleopsis nitida]